MTDPLAPVYLGPLSPQQRALIDEWASVEMAMLEGYYTLDPKYKLRQEQARAIRGLIAGAVPLCQMNVGSDGQPIVIKSSDPSPADEFGLTPRKPGEPLP